MPTILRPPLIILAAGVLVIASTASGRAPVRPVAVRIIDRHGQPATKDRFGDVVGNVQVTFSDGHRETWTRSLRCELPKVSASGVVGWTYAAGRHSRGAWMNEVLCIATSRNDITRFDAARAFIELWAFTEHDSCVVMRSRNIHGPSWIEQYRIATGELVASCSGSDYPEQTPDWAKPYLDDDQ